MTLLNRYFMTGAAVALATVLAVPAFAQQPQPPEGTPAPRAQQPAQASMIEGELASVDTEAKQLVVRTKDGKSEQLRYSDATKVTGGQSGIAGLANARGTQVSVRFTGTGPDRVATEITIHEKK